jgi:Sec-independent protein secretion pathway component TatC
MVIPLILLFEVTIFIAKFMKRDKIEGVAVW